MEYLGAWGTLIHEKNLKSKISCQSPFNGTVSPDGLGFWGHAWSVLGLNRERGQY